MPNHRRRMQCVAPQPAAAARSELNEEGTVSGPTPKRPATKLKRDCDRGCTLGEPCHADVLLEIANGEAE